MSKYVIRNTSPDKFLKGLAVVVLALFAVALLLVARNRGERIVKLEDRLAVKEYKLRAKKQEIILIDRSFAKEVVRSSKLQDDNQFLQTNLDKEMDKCGYSQKIKDEHMKELDSYKIELARLRATQEATSRGYRRTLEDLLLADEME